MIASILGNIGAGFLVLFVFGIVAGCLYWLVRVAAEVISDAAYIPEWKAFPFALAGWAIFFFICWLVGLMVTVPS
jgi:hypothetical protein